MTETDRERWNARYRRRAHNAAEPSPIVTAAARWLPESGRALDVAGGTGKNAVWLAQRGLDVTLADVSDVALGIARGEAEKAGVTISLLDVNLQDDPFPPGPWDVITSIRFLWRPLFYAFRRELAPGGLLIFSQPTRRNLERHSKPSSRYLLDEGEIHTLAAGLETLVCEDDWQASGQHEARLIARRAAEPTGP
jgi:SAM-dependent methyltransferase